MKALVIYYSWTGNTRKIAEGIAKALSARAEVEVEELKERVARKMGFFGFLAAGRDASLKRKTAIMPVKAQLASYDVVIVGTPVWAWGVSSPVRTFLNENGKEAKKVAFFLTTGGQGIEKTFRKMEALCGKAPLATVGVTEKELKNGTGAVGAKVKAFAEKVAAGGGRR